MQSNQKNVLISVFVIAAAVGVLWITLRQPVTTNTPGGDDQSFEPRQATLHGEFLCLPHINSTGPQTMECAYGIKTDAGIYYAVDFGLMSQTPPNIPTGKQFTASGVITPVERLNSDHWRIYPIKGIFSITSGIVLE